MAFLLNARTKTIHRADSTDKRCHLKQQDPENIMEFSSPEEAAAYFPKGRPAKLCPFCLGKKNDTRL